MHNGAILRNPATPFALRDEARIRSAGLCRDPYDYAFVDQAISPRFKDEVLADAPRIPDPGSYGLPSLRYGARFGEAVDDLLSPCFRRLVEEKFDTDQSAYPHTDSRHKIITVLLGFSAEWSYERGRQRVLRSADRKDVAFEFAPEFGRIPMFRVCDHSWHGFLPQKGQRMSLQLCFVDSESNVRRQINILEPTRHEFSLHT